MALSVGAPTAQAATQTTKAAANCKASGDRYYCHNRAGAPVYSRGDHPVVIDHLRTTYSWFVCRKEGAKNNNSPQHPTRWEWTKGDDHGKWGWVKDGDIADETNPLPRMKGFFVSCPWNL